MSTRTIIIARDGGEAEIISKNPLAKQHQILTLSPGASAGFMEGGFNTIDTTAIYNDDSHVQTIINQQNIQSEFRELAGKLGTLSEIQIDAAANTLFYMSGAASFYFQALTNYDKFYILEGETLEEINGFDNAFQAIVSRILKKRYGGRDHEFSNLHRWLMKKYNQKIIELTKGKRKVINIDGARPSSKNFAKAAVKLDPEIVILSGRNPAKNIFTALKFMKISLKILKKKDYFSQRIPMYFFYPAKVRDYDKEAKQITKQGRSKFSKTLFQIAEPYISNILKLAAGYEASMKEQVAALHPDVITADGLASGYTVSVAKYAKEIGIKVLLFNHASHSPQTSPISKQIGNLWASLGIIHSPYATHIGARSPHVANLSKEIDPSGNIIGVRHDKKIPLKPHNKFKILFAGNYLNVQEHVPWMLETPDEFIKGIAELVEAVRQIPEAELTIRVKPGKKDFNAEIMKKFIPSYPNVIISNQGTLKEALEETDLMVASISSTVDEALHSGRPLLLHSGPKRYQHLPEGRAVYASKRGEPLVDTLRKIIAELQDKPLTDADLAPYIWAENEADMEGLAKRILEL